MESLKSRCSSPVPWYHKYFLFQKPSLVTECNAFIFLWKQGSIISNPRNIETTAMDITTINRMYFPKKKPWKASMKQTKKSLWN